MEYNKTGLLFSTMLLSLINKLLNLIRLKLKLSVKNESWMDHIANAQIDV